ncbi:transmembrane protein, putative [Medicago truncatula]|uniref:Transmembrane protein, putative n=1 Tax=Medicago truncatula TaxID=3880 RepID=A2Q3K3_MEDTR|nr:hypothetical protein MtrDRAFT_AC155884g17v2 [Medicago truncatula]AES66126.1 transmembrane protein, putative [Medicago truncatula]
MWEQQFSMSYIHPFRNAKQKHLYTSLYFCLILSISVSALIEPPYSSPKHDDRVGTGNARSSTMSATQLQSQSDATHV